MQIIAGLLSFILIITYLS